MYAEPWLLEQQHQAALERRCRGRPVCADCGQPIADAFCFQLEDGWLCPECVNLRFISTEAVSREELP